MPYEEQLKSQLFLEPSQSVNDLSHRVLGCAIEVHRHLGPGYREQTYQLALEAEFGIQRLEFRSQVSAGVVYKGLSVGDFRLDFVVGDSIVLEIKTIASIDQVHVAQVIAYLKATRHELGIILNFNTPVMKHGIKRVLPPR